MLFRSINDLGKNELAKHPDITSKFVSGSVGSSELSGFKEGDPDFKNDRSRIYVSQNTMFDQSLDLVGYNSDRRIEKDKIKDSVDGDAGIIIKSDKIRIFSRNDVQIIVSGYEETSVTEGIQSFIDQEEGVAPLPKSVRSEKSYDKGTWASITIKSNGDIVFEPSEYGYIKLGGEDANKGIV